MIILKTPEEIELIFRAGQIVAECQKVLIRELKPGMTTLDLDSLTETCIRDLGGIPAFKGYRNYPKSLCASINEEVVHGIPSRRVLNEGDIIGLDVGAIVEGFYGDGWTAVTSDGSLSAHFEHTISIEPMVLLAFLRLVLRKKTWYLPDGKRRYY